MSKTRVNDLNQTSQQVWGPLKKSNYFRFRICVVSNEEAIKLHANCAWPNTLTIGARQRDQLFNLVRFYSASVI